MYLCNSLKQTQNIGTILKIHGDDTFDIKYTDGDVEKHIKRSHIRKKKKRDKKTRPSNDESDRDSNAKFEKGDKIEARFRAGRQWFLGKIIRVRSDGTYDILYEDGDEEKFVKEKLVRKSRRGKNKKDFSKGDNVEARYGGHDKFYKGIIHKIRSDGTFDVKYEDGDIEKRVPVNLIRLISRSKKKYDSDSSSSSEEETFEVDDTVEARFNRGNKWYAGKITNARSDGTFDIEYDDGETERRVKKHLIRQKRRGRTKKKKKKKKRRDSGSDDDDDDDDKLREGDKVEARFGGRDKWYAGKITNARSDGTFDIMYEDGDTERRVKKRLVRKKRR